MICYNNTNNTITIPKEMTYKILDHPWLNQTTLGNIVDIIFVMRMVGMHNWDAQFFTNHPTKGPNTEFGLGVNDIQMVFLSNLIS